MVKGLGYSVLVIERCVCMHACVCVCVYRVCAKNGRRCIEERREEETREMAVFLEEA